MSGAPQSNRSPQKIVDLLEEIWLQQDLYAWIDLEKTKKVSYKGSTPVEAGAYYCPYVPVQFIRPKGKSFLTNRKS